MPPDDKTTMKASDADVFDLDRIPRSTYAADGLTRLNPDWIDDFIIEQAGEQARDRAWREIIPQWLRRLGSEMRGDYRLDETPEFTILQPSSVEDPNRLSKHAEKARARAMRFWPGLDVEEDTVGKHVIIVAETQDDYYDYTSSFYSDGHYGGSSGMCIRSTGYTHIVVNATAAYDQEAILAHEIAHALLAQLALPNWVEEGMVQIVEESINMTPVPFLNGREQCEYWAEHTLAGFWLGSAFHEEGPGQSHAYALARHMVYELAKKDLKQFIAFANAAHFRDAGRVAATEHLGHGLAGCLPEFLQMKLD